ncbi:MAG TPA: UDP-GlcNAc--UDP-phosphate GlcNAc-1-phosphate transferase, partial [Phnomibacter sp.]|nr:UDP-GlcNAc--UDP-phosphate GlcNAc-1-phosphate transferase [Phnomibacter sp.]
MAVYLYVLVPVALLILELLYFKIADRLNIIDKPNQRSSHQQITLRGGGIIFPLSILLYFLIAPLSYPWFVLGLMIIAAISFADDIKPQSTLIRLILHIAAAGLLAHQAALWPLGLGMVALALILVIGTINAFNFMDGINGITSGYAFTVMAGLYLCNIHLNFIDPVYLYCLLMGNLVFAFFNFRKKARCFAGDVGSVSMAFCLLFPLVLLIKASGNFIFILFFALYGVDTVLTLIHRLIKRENIFEAHRQH